MGSSSVATASKLKVRPIAGSLGAEVIGLDYGAVSAVADELRKALNEHLVLFMPGLNPTAEGLRDIAATFGPLEVHPYLDKVDPEIPEVIVLDTSSTPKADVWHTDFTCSDHPPVAALLHMVESPPWGGDTMWINCYEVYDSLSAAMQEFVEGLTCLHEDTRTGGAPAAEHPVVRVHPDTGRKSLYVNKQFSRRIPQLSRPESQNLLSFLFRWEEQVKFSCRWRWNVGDVVLWDERVTLHSVVDDTSERRLLRRSTVLGDDPCSPDETKILPRHRTPKTASSGFYGIGGYEF